jgi:hypothetical protein
MILQELKTEIPGNPSPGNNAILAYLMKNRDNTAIAMRYDHIRVELDETAAASLPNPTTVSWENYKNNLQLRIYAPPKPNMETVEAHWLPWEYEIGFYVDIPAEVDILAVIVPPAVAPATLFITPPLTGCYVGIQKMEKIIRIYHYNNYRKPLTDNDLLRYGCTDWLIPNTLSPDLYVETHHKVFYEFNTTIWGEYINGAWHFFYKTDGDKHIYLFL